MKQWTALIVACIVVAYQLHYSEAQFSFRYVDLHVHSRYDTDFMNTVWFVVR